MRSATHVSCSFRGRLTTGFGLIRQKERKLNVESLVDLIDQVLAKKGPPSYNNDFLIYISIRTHNSKTMGTLRYFFKMSH